MYLAETNGGRLFTEALTANIHPVLANNTTLVAAYSAGGWRTWRKTRSQYEVDLPLARTLPKIARA
jgi:hypothetical protein